MGRVSQLFPQVRGKGVFFLTLLSLFFLGCFEIAKPPIPLQTKQNETLQENLPCGTLSIVGPLTASQFQELFDCLNRKGSLDPLKPLIVHNTQNADLFVHIYNETFGAHPDVRKSSLSLAKILLNEGTLDDLLNFASHLISEFIDTPDFDDHLRIVMQDLLHDDIDLFTPLKSIVLSQEAKELSEIFRESLEEKTLDHLLASGGEFLRGDVQNLVSVLKTLFKTSTTQNAYFSLEDVDQLNFHHIPRNLLEELYKLEREEKLPILLNLLSQLIQSETTTVLTEERQEILKHSPDLLTQKQKEGSEQILKQHPSNDLSALIKLISSLNRKLMEDEDSDRNQNLLDSINIYLHSVKSAFEKPNTLGPDADATRVMTIYTIYTDIASVEVRFPEFHEKTKEEKIAIYTSEENPYSHDNLYTNYVTAYREIKASIIRKEYGSQLQKERDPNNPDQPRWTPEEIEEKIDEKITEFENTELVTYALFLQKQISKVLYDINELPFFLDFTLYDFLDRLKDKGTKSIALFAQKSLLNLDNEFLDQFIEEVIQGHLKAFFEFHKPVDQFMRSPYPNEASKGSTRLSQAIDLIHHSQNSLPPKDRFTLAAIVETGQILEKLLIKENRIQDIREVFLPFLKAINKEEQEERTLRLCQWLYQPKPLEDLSEENQVANKLSPSLKQMEETGFLKLSLSFLASLGKHADAANEFLSFLSFSQTKRSFLIKAKENFTFEDTLSLRNDIDYRVRNLTSEEDLALLTSKLEMLHSKEKESLISLAQTTLLIDHPKRWITPFLDTTERLISMHPEHVTNLMLHLGRFMTPDNINKLMNFLRNYEKSSSSSENGAESFLTLLLKRDEMPEFIELVDRMLMEDTFKSTHLFFKELIDKGELKTTLHLLTTILLTGN